MRWLIFVIMGRLSGESFLVGRIQSRVFGMLPDAVTNQKGTHSNPVKCVRMMNAGLVDRTMGSCIEKGLEERQSTSRSVKVHFRKN